MSYLVVCKHIFFHFQTYNFSVVSPLPWSWYYHGSLPFCRSNCLRLQIENQSKIQTCQVPSITPTNNWDIEILLNSLFVQLVSTLNWILFRYILMKKSKRSAIVQFSNNVWHLKIKFRLQRIFISKIILLEIFFKDSFIDVCLKPAFLCQK